MKTILRRIRRLLIRNGSSPQNAPLTEPADTDPKIETRLINLNAPYQAGRKLREVALRVRDEFGSDIIGAEFGIAYGGGVEATARIWGERGTIYGFDTFEGHPKHIATTDKDLQAADAVDMWYEKYGTGELSLEYIQSVLDEEGLHQAKLVKGLVTTETRIDYIPYLDYVLLDFDFPSAVSASYELVRDKLTSGSYLCIHDVSPSGKIQGLYDLYEEIKAEGIYEVFYEAFPDDLVVLKRIKGGKERVPH
jgi:hypothetical protein